MPRMQHSNMKLCSNAACDASPMLLSLHGNGFDTVINIHKHSQEASLTFSRAACSVATRVRKWLLSVPARGTDIATMPSDLREAPLREPL